jgi:hypothetical protein
MEERTGIITPVRTVEVVDSEFKAAVDAKDYALIAKLSKEMGKLQADAEKAKREQALAGRAELTGKIKAKIDAFMQKLVDSKALDGCDGIWYTNDFGSTETSLRLFADEKPKRKSSGTGASTGSGKKFSITTKELLEKHGNEAVGESAGKDLAYTVNGVTISWNADTTWNEMSQKSTNGNWQYFKVRIPLLKLESLL